MDIRQHIRELAGELEFALCGVSDARPTHHREHVQNWLADKKHGQMNWLAERVDTLVDPQRLLAGARSIICVADHIGPADKSEIRNPKSEFHNGRIARYAQVDDYHKVLRKRLHRMADALRQRWSDEQFRVCVDTAPLLEREYAHRAGLGWVGKNTMLIHPQCGSHLLLGEIVTTLEIPTDRPEPDHCGTCTRCIDACPTRCISPYQLDASRCISYLTIEHRDAIDSRFDRAMGDWLYGCDICQDVCPYNQPDRGSVSDNPPAAYGPPRPALMDLLAVLGWDENARRAAFTRSAMKRAKLRQMKRNALISAANAHDPPPQLIEKISEIAGDADEDPMVRRTAGRSLKRMKSRV